MAAMACLHQQGGLELLELRHGTSVKTLIPRVAEGVFSVICMFTRNDEYVLYYHGGRKTLRVFRLSDGKMIANYRVQAELTAIAGSADGRSIVLGTIDGCLSSLTIADLIKKDVQQLLASLPSRDPQKFREEEAKQNLTLKRVAKMVIYGLRFSGDSNRRPPGDADGDDGSTYIGNAKEGEANAPRAQDM